MLRIPQAITAIAPFIGLSAGETDRFVLPQPQPQASAIQNPCAFCRDEVMKRQTVYENDDFAVLVDYAPITYGHLLVVPKIHATYLQDIPPEKMSSFQQLVPRIVRVFEEVIKTDQYILLQKNGRQAGQSVPHVHFHFIPVASTKWVIWSQLQIVGKIFFGTRPVSKVKTDETIAVFKEAFQKNDLQEKPK